MSGKVAAFAFYGVKLTNDRQSWSGISPSGEVVVGLWLDEFNYKVKPAIYQPNPATNVVWRDKYGNRERIEHLKRVRDSADRHFRVVVMKAVDEKTDPREVDEAYPRENMLMELIELDEDTGVFKAQLLKG